MNTVELALYPHLIDTQHMIAATLSMANDAENLNRLIQAELCYQRAFVIATMTYDETHPQAISILWDLARVCEKQQKPQDAEHYYNRIQSIGFFNSSRPKRAA